MVVLHHFVKRDRFGHVNRARALVSGRIPDKPCSMDEVTRVHVAELSLVIGDVQGAAKNSALVGSRVESSHRL